MNGIYFAQHQDGQTAQQILAAAGRELTPVRGRAPRWPNANGYTYLEDADANLLAWTERQIEFTQSQRDFRARQLQFDAARQLEDIEWQRWDARLMAYERLRAVLLGFAPVADANANPAA